MKKRTLIAVLGLWIALLPFLGLPASWKSRLIILSGLVVTVLAVSRKKGVAAYTEASSSSSQASPSFSVSSSSNVNLSAVPQSAPVPVIRKPRKPRAAKTEQAQAVDVSFSSEENRNSYHEEKKATDAA